jgi:hypothetical protein
LPKENSNGRQHHRDPRMSARSSISRAARPHDHRRRQWRRHPDPDRDPDLAAGICNARPRTRMSRC